MIDENETRTVRCNDGVYRQEEILAGETAEDWRDFTDDEEDFEQFEKEVLDHTLMELEEDLKKAQHAAAFAELIRCDARTPNNEVIHLAGKIQEHNRIKEAQASSTPDAERLQIEYVDGPLPRDVIDALPRNRESES